MLDRGSVLAVLAWLVRWACEGTSIYRIQRFEIVSSQAAGGTRAHRLVRADAEAGRPIKIVGRLLPFFTVLPFSTFVSTVFFRSLLGFMF